MVSRVALTATVLVLSASDMGDPGFQLELDDLLSLAYLGFAIAMLLVNRMSWWLAFRLQRLAFVVDFLAYAMIMYLIEPMQSGDFAASITVFSFLVLSVAVQWGWKPAITAIIALNLFCLVMIAQMLVMHMPFDWSIVVRRQAYQLLISFFLAWMAGWTRSPSVAELSVPPGLSPPEYYVRALEYAGEQLRSRRGAFCWVGPGEASCRAMTIGLDTAKGGAGENCSSDFVQAVTGPALFDLDRDRCIALHKGRLIRTCLAEDERAFAERFGFRRGIYVPLVGQSGKGRIVLETPDLAETHMLQFVQEVASKLARSFDTYSYYRSAEENAVNRVRDTIARDLHDNVAQSLAGTRYWLDSLRSQAGRGQAIEAELQDLSEHLSSEHSQILGTIEYLRKPTGTSEEDLATELEALAESMARHWQVTVSAAVRPDQVLLPVALAHELKALCREAVSNAVRHGRASHISVTLDVVPGNVNLTIANDGLAFDPDKTRPKSIAARVQKLDGKLDIASQNGETRIAIVIPWGGN